MRRQEKRKTLGRGWGSRRHVRPTFEMSEGGLGLKKFNGLNDSNGISVDCIQVPGGVTTIQRLAFNGNAYSSDYESGHAATFLRWVYLPADLKEIEASAFNLCASLRGVVVPVGVVKIAARAFSGCKELASILVPKSVKEVAGNAIVGCEKLNFIITSKEIYSKLDFGYIPPGSLRPQLFDVSDASNYIIEFDAANVLYEGTSLERIVIKRAQTIDYTKFSERKDEAKRVASTMLSSEDIQSILNIFSTVLLANNRHEQICAPGSSVLDSGSSQGKVREKLPALPDELFHYVVFPFLIRGTTSSFLSIYKNLYSLYNDCIQHEKPQGSGLEETHKPVLTCSR